MQGLKVAIPVLPHVKQYLLHNPFIAKPFRISMEESFGIFLYQFLANKKSNYPMRYDVTKTIEVDLGNKCTWHYKMYIPADKAKAFNAAIEKRLKEEFDMFITVALQYHPNAKVDHLIKDFEFKYQLQETKMSFQTLKRRYYRNDKALELLDSKRLHSFSSQPVTKSK